jgi:hypothetical protein
LLDYKNILCFKWGREEAGGSWDCGGDLTNIQCKPIQNCHKDSQAHTCYPSYSGGRDQED